MRLSRQRIGRDAQHSPSGRGRCHRISLSSHGLQGEPVQAFAGPSVPFRRWFAFCLRRAVPLLSDPMKHAFEIGRHTAHRARRLRPLVTALGLSGLLVLSGCAGAGRLSLGRTGVAPATPPTAAAPTDPLLAFAARAQPGTQESVTLADGQPASLRLVRAYHAASGRECREISVADVRAADRALRPG